MDTSSPSPATVVTFRAGAVIVGDPAGTVFTPGEVSYSGSVLTYVGPPRPGATGRLIDIADGAVLPGLWNGHNHAAMALLRGYADDSRLMPWLQDHVWPVEARMTADDIYVGTLLAAAEMIRGGTVAYADMYMFPEAVARASREAGVRAYIARGLVGSWPEAQDDLSASVELTLKWREEAGLVEGWLGPHAPYTCTPELLEHVADEARRHQIGIHVHLSESEEEVAQMAEQYQTTPVGLAERCGLLTERTLIAHGVYLTAQDQQAIAGARSGVVHCPVSNLKLGNGIAPVTELMEAGIKVGLGTDGPASTNRLDMFTQMRVAAWLQKSRQGDPSAFNAIQALGLATSGSAAVLGAQSGVLRAGLPADLAVVKWHTAHTTPAPDPVATLVYATDAADVRYTVVAGEILLDDGIITKFDEQAAIEEARSRARALLGR